ncbi:hypothetical protein [Stieleria varia]|uniref:Uncharacterized protein n=1 Tax=Stieleria varia TaxID=2528005 RepID=A0A5C6B883_9BACT|nr:hypothetical protein [Stieleria varia]TWU08293.1 hypothetical protein Pla52n_08750 [Stieleria varia]
MSDVSDQAELHRDLRGESKFQRAPLKTSAIAATAVALITLGIALSDQGEPVVVPAKENSSASAAPAETIQDTDTPLAARVYRAGFFDEYVQPEIARADQLNRESAERCLKRIDTLIDQYHRGVDPFVRDLTSLSTRFGIVRRMPGGWWNQDDRVQTYVRDKFEQHLFSQETLLADVSAVLNEFKQEIDTNQRRMLVSIKAALSESDLPSVLTQEYPEFFDGVSKSLQGYAADQGTSSVHNMVGAFVLGEAGAFAARSLLGGLLARFAPSAAVAAASGATAAAGSSAAGAGSGSLGGPVGAVVGFGVGLAVGLVIDWWMTERFEAELSSQMHGYLDDLNRALISGPDASMAGSVKTDTPSVGLAVALPQLCDGLADAYRERFFEQIVSGAPTP